MVNFSKQLEIERIVNLVVNFGWQSVKEEVEGDVVKITFAKTISGPESKPPEKGEGV